MTSKAFVPEQDKFYAVNASDCPKCGKVKLNYEGCNCEDAFRVLLRDYLDVQYDVKVAMLGRMKTTDIYLEGLIRGEITCLIKIKEMIKEFEK